MNGEGETIPGNHLELYVKAGQDGECYGGCPFCQRMFMILLIKATHGELTFNVTTVNLARPPPEFKKMSSRLPAIVHNGEVLNDEDEMIQYINEHFPNPPMEYNNRKAAEVCREVFSRFSFYIKEVSHTPQSLLSELAKLNAYLEQSPHKFLCRDEPDHLDCLMLPKLQHIRVAAKAFKDFKIPSDMTGLWGYLGRAYATDYFKQTCPSDQEIIYHWTSKPELPRLPNEKQLIYEGTPLYSLNVPK